VTLLVYLPALRNGFVNWDDNVYITENARLLAGGAGFVRWAFLESGSILWHPLTWLSHGLDYALWGLRPAGHHLTSVLLHAVNAALAGVLALRLIDASAAGGRLGSRDRAAVAGLVALLFGLHPLHVESVAWVAERKDVLSGLFFLLCAIAYLGWRRAVAEGRPGAARYLGTLALAALAMLSKPMAVTLPAVLLLLDLYPLRRPGAGERWAGLLLEKAPFAGLSAATVLATVMPASMGATLATAHTDPLAKLLVAARAVISYLGAMLWPRGLVPLYLAPDEVSLRMPVYAGCLALAAGITAAAFLLRRGIPALAAAWGWYLVTLLPVLGIVQVGPHVQADRYTYLPSFGPFFVAALGAVAGVSRLTAGRVSDRARTAALALPAAVLAGVLAWRTGAQIAIWRDSPTLWSAVIAREPRAYIAYNNLGNIRFAEGNVAEALRLYRVSAGLRVDATVLNNLAICSVRTGDLAQAYGYARRAIEAAPRDGHGYHTAATVRMKSGDYAGALDLFLGGLAADPGWPLHNAYGAATALEGLGRTAEACRYWAQYLAGGRNEPDFAETVEHVRAAGCGGRRVE
jgi:hypothetical protein